MSWSTELFCNLSFSRETFNSKEEVQERINEVSTYLQIAKDNLRNMIMMTEPQKFCPENYDPFIWMSNECKDSLEDIEEYSIELYKLRTLEYYWDKCHNEEGLAIDPPEDVHWDSAFLTGDFIKSVKHPNANSIFGHE